MASVLRGSDNFDSAGINALRAWVNFNGTGTVAIRDSGNVSSITDNGVGDFTANFATAFADTNYACAHSFGAAGSAAAVTSNTCTSGLTGTEVAPTVSAFRLSVGYTITSGAVADPKYASLTFFH